MHPTSNNAPIDASETIAEHFHRSRFEDLPAQTLQQTKLLFLDTFGAAIAGLDAEGCEELQSLVLRWGGAPEAGLIGHPARVPAHHAALMNATRARALELDDVHEQALVHATATVVPVALAAAERFGNVSGAEVLNAVALGIDLSCRLGLAPKLRLGGADYIPRAISRSYTTGTLAGSLVAAKLGRFHIEKMKNAFGLGYSQCAGNQQGLAEGTLSVRVQQGLCAQSAIMAAELADVGISGTRQSLEGKYGYFEAFWRGEYDRSQLLTDLGKRFEGDHASIKPYACCKYSHTGIAAAIEATQDPSFRIEDVDRVVVHVASRDCWELLCEPLSAKADPANFVGAGGWTLAQFSYPFVVACALVRGRLTTEELSHESRSDPAIIAMLRKIEPRMEESSGPAVLPEPGRVEVFLKSGHRIERSVRHAMGHPTHRPMDETAMREKFGWCTRRLPAERSRAIADRILQLEKLADVRELIALAV